MLSSLEIFKLIWFLNSFNGLSVLGMKSPSSVSAECCVMLSLSQFAEFAFISGFSPSVSEFILESASALAFKVPFLYFISNSSYSSANFQ